MKFKKSGQLRCHRMSPPKMIERMSFNRKKYIWQNLEDDLYLMLDGRVDRLQICKEFHFGRNHQRDGLLGPNRSRDLLWTFAYLFSSNDKDIAIYDEHVSRLASFLSTGRDVRCLKLAVVRTFYKMCRTKPKYDHYNESLERDDNQFSPEKLFKFLTNRVEEWNDALGHDLSTMAFALVYEIRAKCLRNLDLERNRIKSVTDKGENTAVIIATGAKIMELGIQKSNKIIESRISNAGQRMKGWIDDASGGGNNVGKSCRKVKNIDDRDALIIRTFSGSTKRVSEYARQGSNRIAQSTLDNTLTGLHTIGNKVEKSSTEMIDQIHPENREMIKAVGKIGVASVGAVALVAEAFIETSRSLSSKTVGVTADIVGHTYGSVAGEVARDAADTYTNIVQIMGNIAVASNGSKLVKKAAKTAGKNQIDEDVEKAKDIIMKVERHGAIVAKKTLGIQWAEGNWTKELLYDAASNDDKHISASIHPKGVFSFEKNKNLLD
mmetsp:Transcript_26945/g.63285  ORF Transcript_26945/g.63285 Transcript_26945/m.63285 type:complete len:493 (-) Transcript_26945:168-1646(-)